MTMIPLYGFLEGDSLGLLILAEDDETIASLSSKLVRSAAVRVSVGRTRLIFEGCLLDPSLTVRSAGMKPLSRFDVRVSEGK